MNSDVGDGPIIVEIEKYSIVLILILASRAFSATFLTA